MQVIHFLLCQNGNLKYLSQSDLQSIIMDTIDDNDF